MRKTIPSAGGLVLLSLCIATLAGCASSTPGPAPILERNASRGAPAAATASAPLEPGFHLVQRGDTLYSVARQYGQDPKNIIIWNQLENPNSISPGQRIRVGPPGLAAMPGAGGTAGAGVEVKPIAAQTGVEVRPLGSEPGAAVPVATGSAPAAGQPAVASAGSIKQEPRGGKIAYSEQAWAKARGPDDKLAGAAVVAPPAAAADAKPAAKAEPAPPAAADSKPEPKTDSKADSKAENRPADGAADWSWPTGGKVVVAFNDSTSKGIDISGKLGDPVLAAGPGKVLYAGQDLRGYGKLVVVKHNNQYLSVYAHNSEILVKEGQSVTKGQKIAELGKSDAPEPKLHFEIRKQGKPVDPMQYLPAR